MRPFNIFFLLGLVIVHCGCSDHSSDSRGSNLATRKGAAEDHKHLSDDQGEVAKIVDGDTFDLLLNGDSTIRIRMSEIDAPEKGQPFYQKAKDFLSGLCLRKHISIRKLNMDRWGRIIANSYTDEGLSLSATMVKYGFAWQFLEYSNDSLLTSLEVNARKLRLGLWADPHPIQPWRLRAEKRKSRSR